MTGVLGSKKDGEAEIRYHKDPHGNVLATEKNNALTGEYTYDAFGNQLTTAELDNPFRYCGEYFDKESGNIYLRNRYYDTRTGRFLNEDPIKDGLNWYSYCGGNPVMLIDPMGLYSDAAKRFEEYYLQETGCKNAYIDYRDAIVDNRLEEAEVAFDKIKEHQNFCKELNELDSKGALCSIDYSNEIERKYQKKVNDCWICCMYMLNKRVGKNLKKFYDLWYGPDVQGKVEGTEIQNYNEYDIPTYLQTYGPIYAGINMPHGIRHVSIISGVTWCNVKVSGVYESIFEQMFFAIIDPDEYFVDTPTYMNRDQFLFDYLLDGSYTAGVSRIIIPTI